MKNPFGRFQQIASGPIDPFVHTNKDHPAVDPFVTVGENPNDPDHFAILKTTENGRYVKGGLLYFEFNGVGISTELSNVIFIDRLNKSVFIKNYDKVIEEITPKNPEERQYIILYSTIGEDGHMWEAMTGRSTAYQWIVDNIEDCEIDPNQSFVLVDNVPYKDALTVTAFVRYLKNAELVSLFDGFDIDDYIYE